jgi:hypothetical protein
MPGLPDLAACGNCGTPLAGAYCHACGQKRLGPGDRGLGHLLGEAFHKLTDLDGTLLRSLRLLLFAPGRLARDWMEDRRVRHASPVSLFLLANLVYFFAPAMSDFNLPFVDQVPASIARQLVEPGTADYARRVGRASTRVGQQHSRWTAQMAERVLARRRAQAPGYSMRDLARDYDARAGVVGKVLIVAHVPFMALALALVFVRQRRYFTEHLVVALHLFAFLLLFAQLVVAPLNWLGRNVPLPAPDWLGVVLALLLTGAVFAYLLLACRVAYRARWPMAALGMCAVAAGLLFANLWFYRALQFVVTLLLL